MKICHVITRLIIGGAQENTILTCKGLVELGHAVTLVAGPETGPEGSLWTWADTIGCQLVKIDSLCRAVHPINDWRACQAMTELFRDVQPDVVHTHSSKAGIIGREAAARASVPMVIHTIHGMSFNRTQSWGVRAVYRMLEQRAARQTTAFVCVADAMTLQAVDAGIAPMEKFTTIYSGMETDRFKRCPETRQRVRRLWGINDQEIVVGTVARLFKNKGYEDIIEALPLALAKEPNLRFVWVGDGPHRLHYEQQLKALGIGDRVHFTGLVPPAEVSDLINGFDIIVHASKWEGLPRAIVQGLLCEVPAISYDNDGASEVVKDGLTGVLIEPGKPNALGDAIARLATDRSLREQMGKAGRLRCLAPFDWHTMVTSLDQLYEKQRCTLRQAK